MLYIHGSKVIESIQQFFWRFLGSKNLCETEHWLRERRFVIDFWPVNNLTSLLKVTPSKNKLVCSNDTFRLRFKAKKDESGLKRFVKNSTWSIRWRINQNDLSEVNSIVTWLWLMMKLQLNKMVCQIRKISWDYFEYLSHFEWKFFLSCIM